VRINASIFLIACLPACGGASESAPEPTDPREIATAVCEAVPECVSTVHAVNGCVDIQLDCRSQLDNPSAWDDHMLDCLALDRSTPEGCEELVLCVQDAPRPPSCEGSRP